MKRTAAITLNANMTPMIDVTFLLIVFFVVVSQIVDRDVISLVLPAPENPAAMVTSSEHKMVINLVPLSDGSIKKIIVGKHSVGTNEMKKLSSVISQGLASGTSEVHLRADRSTKYEHVHQVIEAVRGAGGNPRLHLVVDMEERL
ncbi:MAG TPA: biopolymer transporter ExbD [Phycisphaerales bacterium]|nr:biopolymer transporter ExbD [Phycisphaerales bacterium]